jgi:hypothetical protein
MMVTRFLRRKQQSMASGAIAGGKLLIWTPKKQTISFAAGMATWE